jgi:hypothetical protein
VVRLRPAHGENATRTPLIVMEAGRRKSLTRERRISPVVQARSFTKEWEGPRPAVGVTRTPRFRATRLAFVKEIGCCVCGGLHQPAVANDEATMNFEWPVGNTLPEGEPTGLRRGVRRIKILPFSSAATKYLLGASGFEDISSAQSPFCTTIAPIFECIR